MTLAVNIAQGGSNNVTFRNRIINGACVIDQRNAGASVTPSANPTYTLDRWNLSFSQASKFTVQQTPSATETGYATRVAAGFTNYLATTVASSVSIGAGDYFVIQQQIEGYNIADLAWGTANAKSVTLSFWAYSSLTGTFGGAIGNSAGTASYPFTYTISSANTWTQISVTIAGNTSATWLSTNGIGMYVRFGLGVGSTYSATSGSWAAGNYLSATGAVSVVGTGSATFYITGVQLEAGTTASPFEYRQYGTELALCQRYYWQVNLGGNGTQYYAIQGQVSGNAYANWKVSCPVPMRSSPSISISPAYNTGSGWQINITSINNYAFTSAPSVGGYDGNTNLAINCNLSGVPSTYYCLTCIPYVPTGASANYIYFSSEL